MDILVARTKAEIDEACARLSSAAALGCDTETSALNARFGKLFSVQFSDGSFSVLVPISEGIQIGPFAEILADPRIVKIFHNAKFDLDFLCASGLQVRNVFDTMIAEKVITKGANQSASLAETLYRYFAVDLEKSHRTQFNRSWNGIWTDELVSYAVSDVAHLPALMHEQAAWLDRLGLRNVYAEQMTSTELLAGMSDPPA